MVRIWALVHLSHELEVGIRGSKIRGSTPQYHVESYVCHGIEQVRGRRKKWGGLGHASLDSHYDRQSGHCAQVDSQIGPKGMGKE